MDVKTRVREHYEIAKTVVPEELIVGCFLYGSQNYNMADENSDVDTRVLVVPSLADVVCARRPLSFEYHCENGEHINFVDVREFVHQLLKQNPNSLEILFTDYFVINPPFKGVWYYIWSHREDFARINPHRAVNAMRHMANANYHQMMKGEFDHKKLATMIRLEKAISDYILGCKYEHVLKSDQASFFLRVKRGNFIENEEQGLRFAQETYEAINRIADKYISHVSDVDNEKMKEKLMRALADLVCMHLDYEIKAREEKEEEENEWY